MTAHAPEIAAAFRQIDLEVTRGRDIHAKAEHIALIGPSTPHWLLNSPPGHLSMADVEHLRQLHNTVDVAERCQAAAAVIKRLLIAAGVHA